MAKNKEAHVDPVTSSSSCQTPAIQNHIESSFPCVGMSIQIPVVDPQLIQMAENSSGSVISMDSEDIIDSVNMADAAAQPADPAA
ncbi:hypothetical protein NC652_013293 [Populus alba x Populus x berolinensis]|uniref:Uncharacterized protein n=1 Tax=Populus alba x Populus x berolinensis TaxID=444605 RepID=A0AAD6W2B5_9ROSI|nr:hypothetical protein NC652_013293 [Populus alba x Populus x berolinensis]KAJ6996600.1 hypothetical protein NC653_013262 [Populus alba x Populus x berolinensis]